MHRFETRVQYRLVDRFALKFRKTHVGQTSGAFEIPDDISRSYRLCIVRGNALHRPGIDLFGNVAHETAEAILTEFHHYAADMIGRTGWEPDFASWLKERHPEVLPNSPEEWWDRTDTSHPDLDWARGGSTRWKIAGERGAANLGITNLGDAQRMEKDGASREEIWRKGGEVEVRNVEHRLAMTAEERAATPPWATEDVPEDRQIIRFKSAPGSDTDYYFGAKESFAAHGAKTYTAKELGISTTDEATLAAAHRTARGERLCKER